MNKADFAKAASKVMGDTFAETSALIRRLKDVTYRVARLNEDGYRQGKGGELYWRLVVAVPVTDLDRSDQELVRSMIRSAVDLLQDRLEALEPNDGLERVEVRPKAPGMAYSSPEVLQETADVGRPRDLRTREGRAWRAWQRTGATA